jgi:hypothetical protein
MQMKKSEIFDRWTILLQKARFNDLAKKELETEFDPEVSTIMADLIKKDLGKDYVLMDVGDLLWSIKFLELIKSIMQLQEANAKIWVLEASIRREFPNDPSAKKALSMEEVGERAIMIRDFNSLRIKAKKAIDEYFGEISDVKVDHASSST